MEAAVARIAKVEDTFETLVARERERLEATKGEVMERRKALDEEIAAIDKEMAAVNAYDAVKRGKAVPGASAGGGGRAPRGSRQEGLLEIIEKHPEGIGRSGLLEELGLTGDEKAAQSISNALSALKKKGAINGRDRKYFPR